MSDLHLEMARWRVPVPGWTVLLGRHRPLASRLWRGPKLNDLGRIDLIAMAGDIHNGLRGIAYADRIAKFMSAPVVYVAGNHEFYHHDIDQLLPMLTRAASRTRGRVTFLENAVAGFTFHGQHLNVLGCTLWSDYALHGDPAAAMTIAARRMSDHAIIHCENGLFTPGDALARHKASRHWLHETLARLDETEPGVPVLIVTHHAPSPACLGARTGDIAPAYGSDLVKEFAHFRPTAWINGHTHFRHDSVEAGIRLVSAPRGYPVYGGAAAPDYRPGVLELRLIPSPS